MEDERAEVRKLTAQVLNQDRTTTQHPRQSSGVAEGSDADRVENEARLAELESELDTANREVGRLRVQLASPARRAQVELKDLEIGQLRAQKAELEEHLGALREQNLSFSTIQAAATPRRPGFQQGTPAKGSPLPKSILALKTPMRTPRTPGELSEVCRLFGSDEV